MFLANKKQIPPILLPLTMGLLVLLIGATFGTMWLVYEVRKEQDAIGELLRVHTSEKIDSLAPFPEELRWQLILTIVLLIVLVSAFVILSLVLRGYLNSQESLLNVQREAGDILESMGEGVITGDREGRISLINREALRVLGSLFPTNDATLEQLDERTGIGLASLSARILQHQSPVRHEPFEFRLADNQVNLLVDGHVLLDGAGEVHGTVLHLRDVTEDELIRKRMQRMEGYMGLGPVAAGLQHEIKNPLSALSLHVQLLAENLVDETDPNIRENLDVLGVEVPRIAGVLEAFRNYATADALNLRVQNVGDLISHAEKLVTPQAAEKSVRIVSENSKAVLLNVDGDRIQQVLLNLLLNGLDAMSHPGAIQIRLETPDAGSLAKIVVVDQGSGIASAVAPNIFDPYFTTKPEGTGMGLAVCRKIARLHGGDLQFETGSSGTAFSLTLPLQPDGNN
ncbi:MAG: two-component system sensor histidine kinase HydH [Yoonia sp.]